MQRLYSLLSILILAWLLSGCTAGARAKSEKVKAAEQIPATDLPPKPTPVDTATLEVVSHDPPASCPLTQAPDVPFIPPEPYPSRPPERYLNQFWYGTPELWTMLSTEATWRGLPHDKYGYSEKVFWWSKDFHVSTDPYPAFTVTIERLDVNAAYPPRIVSREATNASADFGTAMLTGVAIPKPGCWKITGQYQQAELSFVVWITP